jgi:endonuclease YncB( thermonuclease family)
MKWVAALLFCLSIPGVASAGTVTGVQPSVPSIGVGAPFTVTVTGTNPCGADNVDYGDGTAITYAITGLPATHSHKYDKPGPYTIVARGMGNCDGEVRARIQVTGAPPPPPPPPTAPQVTGLSFSPRPAVVRQPVTIDIAGHGDCSLTIAFGDGNQQELTATLPQRVTHTYALVRTYAVVVAPAAPCTGKFTEPLQVAARGGNRITGLAVDPEITRAGAGITIAVEGAGTCTYRLDYGDGNTEDRSKAMPDRLHHVYNAAGTYTISAVASGSCQGSAQHPITVR